MGVSRRTKQKELKKNFFAIAIIAIFAIVVFSINSIGNFIATKIIQPVINLTETRNEKVVTNTLKTEKLTLYLLCAGEMPTEAEAETLKTFVCEKGGGGYVFQQDNSYYIIHSVYKDKTKAEAKGQELSGEFSPLVITLNLEETVIKVTGKDTQLKTVYSCFSVLNDVALTLENTCNQINNGEISNLEAMKNLQKLKNSISDGQQNLKELNSSNTKVLAISDMLVLSQTLLNQMPASDDATFKQRLNYTACAYVCEFYKFYCSLE
ncbi:MAG: hypothetical protein E7365_02570 [Clostridiales bacterium]|nr:hypothetical protein [Clostridiales bacterium]